MTNSLISFLIQDRPVSTAAERYLLVYMVAVLVIVTTLVIVFFVLFQKRKNKLLIEKIQQQQAFEEEFAKSQIEIQEETLKHLGQELHDNIGQLLSIANMQLSLLTVDVSEKLKERFTDAKNIVKQSLSEVRSLSKTLNTDVILNLGFQESVSTEIERLNKMKLIKAELIRHGDSDVCKNNKDAIILFRILQEFISNTVKYSKATQLKITLSYSQNHLSILAEDNGVGFDINTVEKGSGLINIEGRAKLIKTKFNLISKPNEGVKLTLDYPIKLRAIKS